MTDAIADYLRDVRDHAPAGAFAVRVSADPEPLLIHVRGVGDLQLPITPAQAEQLRAVARRAPYGRGEATLHDTRVRDTWAVAKSRVRIDQRRWKPALAPLLAQLADELGLGDMELRPVLHKLLVYEPGQHFAPHQDSEADDDMLGSLIVVLPSDYRGGSLVVEHRGQRKTFARVRGADRRLSMIAFYADCQHQLKPVTSGYRVALTYHLLAKRASADSAPPSDLESHPELADHLRRHFATPIPHQWRDEVLNADRLVVFLDHQYTQRSLDWGRLKGDDRARAAALQSAAVEADCCCHLALADIHETWGCDDDGHYYRGRFYPGADEPVATDLHDTAVELISFVGRGHGGGRAYVQPHELCLLRPNDEFEPYETEHTGHMGNYGNTIDRWYHRAAIVLWPRARDFALRGAIAPDWAVHQLEQELATGEAATAAQHARSLRSDWAGARQLEGEDMASLLRVATQLGDPQLAADLLGPCHFCQLGPDCVDDLQGLVRGLGTRWTRALFDSWLERERRASDWTPRLLPILHAILASGVRGARGLARHVLASRVLELTSRMGAAHVWRSLKIDEEVCAQASTLLIACAELDDREQHASLGAALLMRSHLEAGEVLRRSAIPPGDVHRQLLAAVRQALASADRQPDDWSIQTDLRCACADCERLGGFLADADARELDWPLAKARRQHIHRAIDVRGLPVTHTTLRRGSPYILQLRKTTDLHAQAHAWQERHAVLADWLAEQCE